MKLLKPYPIIPPLLQRRNLMRILINRLLRFQALRHVHLVQFVGLHEKREGIPRNACLGELVASDDAMRGGL